METRPNLIAQPSNLRRAEWLTGGPQRHVQRRARDDRHSVDRQLLKPRQSGIVHAQHRVDMNLRSGGKRLDDLLRLPPQCPQNPIQRTTAIPQTTVHPDTDSSAVELGVDDEDASRPDHQMVDVGRRAWYREIVKRNEPVSLKASQSTSSSPLPLSLDISRSFESL